MARQTLLTGEGLLTEKNQDRLADLFAEPAHEPVQTTWKAYQQMVAAYRHKNPIEGKAIMENLITSLKNVPQHLVESASSHGPWPGVLVTSWPTSTYPGHQTVPPRPSTADSNTYAAAPSASATSPTTSPAASSTAADSKTNYTPNYEEPQKVSLPSRRDVGISISGP